MNGSLAVDFKGKIAYYQKRGDIVRKIILKTTMEIKMIQITLKIVFVSSFIYRR